MRIGVSYIPSHQPNYLEADMKYLKEIGCTDVLFALQENHFQWLNGAVRFGPKIAKDNGLRPTAVIWGYANTTGGGRSSKVMLENPDMWRCGEDGMPYSSGYPDPRMCFNNPKAVSLYTEYVRRCWNNGFEGILIDEPSPQDCFCTRCRRKFAEVFGKNLVEDKNSEDYKSFQQNTVIEFVSASCASIKGVNEKMETSLCMMPCDKPLFEKMATIEHLDVFATDPYWLRPVNELSFEDAIEVTRYAKSLAKNNNKSFQLYLGCFGISAGLEEKIFSGSKILIQKSEPDSVITWSLRGGIGLADPEECDRPEIAWDQIVRLYRDLSHSQEL
ncbi:MAG: hypothetical protein JXB29_07575 [Sedimentisphaerales bacterium]|nr:hypothetical protein [Sedimentisphaerales bacterium]